MKVYLAKDWTGTYVFANIPKLMQCGGMPPIWSGHKLRVFDVTVPYAEYDIPKGEYIERDVFWSIVHVIR